MSDFRRLEVWQAARRLTREIYRGTSAFPDSEKFGLALQLRKAANSIGANIAEGMGRSSDRDALRFLSIATGSANEVEQHLVVANDVGLMTKKQSEELIAQVQRVRRMLAGLRVTISSRV